MGSASMKLIVANWKAHFDQTQVRAWLETYARLQTRSTHSAASTVSVVIAPPFPLVGLVAEWLEKQSLTNVGLAVQDISPFPTGAYTGAVSTVNLEGWPIQYVIVGHSERRHYFHESHQLVANKVDQILQVGWQPIICVDQPYVVAQAAALNQSESSNPNWVAYEPLSAIGSGQDAPLAEVEVVARQITTHFGAAARVLYGGSVTSKNVATYLTVCDGVLVGTAALQPESFSELVTAARAG